MHATARDLPHESAVCRGCSLAGMRRHIAAAAALALLLMACGASAETAAVGLGIAWNVRGVWHVDGGQEAVKSGSAIEPGALLQPEVSASPHSITVLLPDGQRILYECFTTQDCARGFRVPALESAPNPFAAEMLARIRAALVQRDVSTPAKAERPVGRDEAVAVLSAGNRIVVSGLVSKLSKGSYSYTVRPLGASGPNEGALQFEKDAGPVTLTVPGAGLYAIEIADSLGRPRIDLWLAALAGAKEQTVRAPFDKARAQLADWNEDFQGWPIHEFQREYLLALMHDIKPGAEKAPQSAKRPQTGVTAEPEFTPRPGVFNGDVEVALACATPGAVMHYTVDGSQPFDNSPVYHSTIEVKGTALTIKAFAAAPGKKDSAVVTGIFRVRE